MGVKYRIVNAAASRENELAAYCCAIGELEGMVNHLMSEGWSLQGGVSVQTMVYEFEEDKGLRTIRTSYTRVMACQAMTLEVAEKSRRDVEWVGDDMVLDLEGKIM